MPLAGLEWHDYRFLLLLSLFTAGPVVLTLIVISLARGGKRE